MSLQNEFIEHIKINDSLIQIDINNLQQIQQHIIRDVFIFCKYSFINYENYSAKFMNNKLAYEEIQLINHNSPIFNFTFDEIMSFINKIDIYIVDKNYLINRGINQIFLNNCNLSYFINNGQKYLYFYKELQLLMIEPYNKINILNCLILFYANERQIKKILASSIQNGETLNFYLVNKDFINNFKNRFYYSNIKNILSNNYNYDHFNDYLNNLEFFQKSDEIQKIIKNINDIDSVNKIRILPKRKSFINNNNYKWPIGFELVHEIIFKILLNIYKISGNEMNKINEYQSQYIIYFGYLTLYINYKINPIYFFTYKYDIQNNSYYLFAIIKCNSNIFYELLNKYLVTKTFEQYLIQTNFDFNKRNIFQETITPEKETKLEILLFSENNNININEEQNKNILTNSFKILLIIYKNYQEFVKLLDNKNDKNLSISNIDDIKNWINLRRLPFFPVYIIKNEHLKYCLNMLKFNEINKYEKSVDEQEKKNIINNINNINELNLFNINQNLNILSQKQLSPNVIYSFVDKTFCQELKLPNEKYKPFEAIYFINQNNQFLYFYNTNFIFKIINYKDNSFNLSNYDFNNNINNIAPNELNNNIVFNNHNQIHDIQNNIIKETKLKDLNHCLGLENLGEPCYMNATIQCLCHIKSLKDYFKKNNKFDSKAPLTKCFCELINSLWTESNIEYFIPTDFNILINDLNTLSKGIKVTNINKLIIFIYETMHNELNNPNEINDFLNNLSSPNIPKELRLFRENYYSKNNSIITKIFHLEQSSNLKCFLCKANKLSFTTTSFLIFPLEKVRQHLEKVKYGNFEYVTLEDCFEQNENQEKLTGENQTFCNNCHRKSDFISYNRLYNCPEILTIILNRGKDLKYDISFKFSMYINIRNYVEDKNCNTNYELIGLIAHLGENEMNGHFISYCKSPVDNNWYFYNDTQVNKCVEPENEIKSCGIPYALFYQKQKDSSPIIVLYFSYEDREEYIELNGDILFEDVIIKIYEKHNWLPQIEIRFYIQKGSQMTEIDKNKTISQNGLKNGDKIILL